MPPNLEYIISQLSQIFAQQVPFRGFMDIVNAPSKAVTAAIATKKNDLQGYQLLLDADSVNVEAKIWSGIMCTLLGEYDLAEKILQQSLVAIMNEYNANKPDRDKLKLYQHSLLVNEFLGASYQKLGQLSLAITHFNRAFNDVLEVMQLSKENRLLEVHTLKFLTCKVMKNDKIIFDADVLHKDFSSEKQDPFFKKWPDWLWEIFLERLQIENIQTVSLNQTLFTIEQIEVMYYGEILTDHVKVAADQKHLTIPFSDNIVPPLPSKFSGEKFSLVVDALEKKATEWSLLAAAYLLADIIETHIDFPEEKTEDDINEYWYKRLHDAISFVEKAVTLNQNIKQEADTLLFHIKIAAGEFYPDIKLRINTLFLEPNFDTFTHFHRDSVQAMLQYKKNLFATQSMKESDTSASTEENAKIGWRCCHH